MSIDLERYPHLKALAERNPKYAKAFAGLGNASQVSLPQKACKPIIGPGTELKLLLKRFHIEPKGNCKCNQRAREMDTNGPGWCEEHIEEVIDWLEEEAKKRHMTLLFNRGIARVLVRRAIKNARRKLALTEQSK